MIESQATWSRRDFLTNVAVAGAGAAIMTSPLALFAGDDTDPQIAKILVATVCVDAHNHIDVPLINDAVPGPAIDLAGEMKRSGLAAICMTFAVDYQKLQNPGDAYDRFLNGITSMDRDLEKNAMKRSLNLADLLAAHSGRQPTVIQSVEGSHFLEGHLDRLSVAYNRGLRHLTLLHDSDASVPLGDVFTNPPRWGGLTAFGAGVIRECNRLGILVDLSHADDQTLDAALKVSAKPVIVSHTGLDTRLGQNADMAKMMRPRLISKEQAKMVAGSGGVIGIWTHLSDTALEYAQNIRAMVDVVGIDHVCIGTDTKLTPSYRPPGSFGPGQQGPPPGGDPNKGHDGPPPNGGPRGGERAGERTNHVWQDQTEGFGYAVVGAMLKTGFTAGEIGKVMGGNFYRIFDAATAGH